MLKYPIDLKLSVIIMITDIITIEKFQAYVSILNSVFNTLVATLRTPTCELYLFI